MLTETQKESLEQSIESLIKKGVWYDDVMAIVTRALHKKGWVLMVSRPQSFGVVGLRRVDGVGKDIRFDTVADALKYCFENIFEVQ